MNDFLKINRNSLILEVIADLQMTYRLDAPSSRDIARVFAVFHDCPNLRVAVLKSTGGKSEIEQSGK
jgi:hypothetical protein